MWHCDEYRLNDVADVKEVLDWARSRSADIEGITTAELNALAAAYLPQSRASRAMVLPAPKT